MPPRHISPQTFDDILRELGDDPAIPDPHGIRKTTAPPRVDPSTQAQNPKQTLSTKNWIPQGLNLTPALVFSATLLLCGGSLFFYFESNQSGSELEISGLQSQLLALKKEMEISQEGWVSEREDLYEAMDEIEVSIHTLETKPIIQITQSKPTAIPHEAELRRWRYLGITRMGAIEHAFFHTGKSTLMIAKEDLVLGEWRLTQAKKELATLTHPKGKSIAFKSIPAE